MEIHRQCQLDDHEWKMLAGTEIIVDLLSNKLVVVIDRKHAPEIVSKINAKINTIWYISESISNRSISGNSVYCLYFTSEHNIRTARNIVESYISGTGSSGEE